MQWPLLKDVLRVGSSLRLTLMHTHSTGCAVEGGTHLCCGGRVASLLRNRISRSSIGSHRAHMLVGHGVVLNAPSIPWHALCESIIAPEGHRVTVPRHRLGNRMQIRYCSFRFSSSGFSKAAEITHASSTPCTEQTAATPEATGRDLAVKDTPTDINSVSSVPSDPRAYTTTARVPQ